MGPDVHSGPLTRGVAPTASEEQEPATSSRRRPLLRDYGEAILVAVIFALFVRTFLFQAYQVPTSSMEGNVLAGDHLIVNKFLYAPHGDHRLSRLLPYRALRRGDVFVFRFPPDPRRDYVKRAIALPGDTVAIRDKVVFVNGVAQDEPRVLHFDERVWPDDPETPEEYRQRDQLDPVPVPLGTVFALGDNRDASYDSRFWGPVPLENVRGRALFVYWSFPVRPASDAGLRRFFAVLLHFFDRTRWERICRPVR
jgi:signal peptidase I